MSDYHFSDLVAGAARLITRCLQARPDESVVVVADSRQDPQVVEAFMAAGRAHGLDVSSAIYPTRERDQAEPSAPVAAAMQAADAYILVPTRSIVYTQAQAAARAAGARLLVCSGLRSEILVNVVPFTDYDEMERLGRNLLDVFRQTSEIRITSPDGSDLRLQVQGRPSLVHDGIVSEPGDEDDIPGGGAFVIPIETQSEGRFVFNASLIPPCGRITSPITMQVREGRITRVEGGADAAKFDAWLQGFNDPNIAYISELGFGLNRACYISGTMPGVDESVYGMVHLGVGHNLPFPGGTITAPSHTDGMLSGASVWADGQEILRDGRYCF